MAKLTEKEIKEIIALYKKGETLQSIAIRYNVTKQYVDQVLKKNKIPRREKKKITDKIKAKVKTLADTGKNYEEIGKAVGISKSSVCNALKELGYKRKEKEYVCRTCGGTDWRANGKVGKVCKLCSAKRAREYYHKRKEKNEPST